MKSNILSKTFGVVSGFDSGANHMAILIARCTVIAALAYMTGAYHEFSGQSFAALAFIFALFGLSSPGEGKSYAYAYVVPRLLAVSLAMVKLYQVDMAVSSMSQSMITFNYFVWGALSVGLVMFLVNRLKGKDVDTAENDENSFSMNFEFSFGIDKKQEMESLTKA
jgi:hypothetical protein